MPRIHFLNVKQGDCSIVQHYSGRTTVIDVCNAKPVDEVREAITTQSSLLEKGISGNFQQKKYPVNPISYIKRLGISSIFRFILTHPDMDHMDGILELFQEFSPINFWDSDNHEEKDFEEGGTFDDGDWNFYRAIRDGKLEGGPKRLALLCGAEGKYYRKDDSDGGGDGLHVLAPTAELVAKANETEDYNDSSYVVLYRTNDHKILFTGDAHDSTWEHVLGQHQKDVTGIDLLIAPHHGRGSDRSYEFLDVLKPKLTFFGNANSEHLAYGAWNYRELPFVTSNQAGSMIVETAPESLKLFVTHEPFARKLNPNSYRSEDLDAYFCFEF
jgi:competence protein ComEC